MHEGEIVADLRLTNLGVTTLAANSTTLFLNKALQGTARINITDRIGRLVRSSSQPVQERELIIDLTGMAAGRYLLEVTTPGGTVRTPFVKQ